MRFSNYIYSNAFRFNVKYVLPLLAFLLSYVVIAQLCTSSLSEKDLVSSWGQVSAIKRDMFLRDNGRDTTKRVTIKLLHSNNNFFLFDNDNGDAYERIRQNVSTGDTVSILHRTLLQSIVAFGNQFQILKFEKGGNILYSLDEAKQTFGEINFFETIVMAGLWFLYFYFRHILKLHQGQPK